MPLFNPYRRSYITDPYPSLRRLRAEAAVFRSPEFEAWIVTTHDDCARVLRDHETFSSSPMLGEGTVARQLQRQSDQVSSSEARALVRMDPPEHTRMRRSLNLLFTPRAVAGLRPFIERTVAELLDRAESGQPFEVMAGLAEPLPIIVVLEVLQAPAEDRERLTEWITAIQLGRVNRESVPDVAAAATSGQQALTEYFTEALSDPASLLPGGLLAALPNAEALTDEERIKTAVDVALGGNNSTAFTLANGVLALVGHMEEAEALRVQPELIPHAVDEMLRFDSPNQIIMRFATVDTKLGGKDVRAGDAVFLLVGAANRDPALFPSPDRFDVRRENAHHHLSFGLGIHYCLGMPLLREEANAAFAALLERFDELRFDGGGLLRGGTLSFRGPERLSIAGPA
ncbi:MAG: cytochrome P450 [Dehalococcoidia bacterium]